jgi:hypothetical protein
VDWPLAINAVSAVAGAAGALAGAAQAYIAWRTLKVGRRPNTLQLLPSMQKKISNVMNFP